MTPKAQILTSLAYLKSNCTIAECHAILQLALDLCVHCGLHEEDGDCFIDFTPAQQSEGLSAALTFLRCEARRNKMGDFETILEATNTLVGYCLIRHSVASPLLIVDH